MILLSFFRYLFSLDRSFEISHVRKKYLIPHILGVFITRYCSILFSVCSHRMEDFKVHMHAQWSMYVFAVLLNLSYGERV